MVRVNCQNGDGGGSWLGHLGDALELFRKFLVLLIRLFGSVSSTVAKQKGGKETILRFPSPPIEYQTPLSTKLHPKIYTPNPLLTPKYEKKKDKIRGFRCFFFVFFFGVWFREGIRAFWGSEGFCMLQGGGGDRNNRRLNPLPPKVSRAW